MAVLDAMYYWTDTLLFFGLVALRLWALLDCLVRKGAAFPAVNKLTKPTWVAILLFAGLLGSVPVFGSQLGPISLISVVVAAVYLADVRPAVREISGGRGRGGRR